MMCIFSINEHCKSVRLQQSFIAKVCAVQPLQKFILLKYLYKSFLVTKKYEYGLVVEMHTNGIEPEVYKFDCSKWHLCHFLK